MTDIVVIKSAIAIVIVSLLAITGCQQEPNRQIAAESTASQLTADQLLRTTIEKYSVANSYQDNAVLYLNYRLNGRAIQEPHPWSVAWNRAGLFSADWFNAKIRCDGRQFSVYVFDIETGNLDNQQVLVPANEQVPLEKLLTDKIAGHFVCGVSELPLHESELEHGEPLIHPILGFLNRRFAQAWLNAPDQVSRLPDEDLAGRRKNVLEIVKNTRMYRLWMDSETGIIDQIELPLQYLDSKVLSSQEIGELSFVVRFHDATLNAEVPPQRVEVKEMETARPVQQFVTLPQAMASERIGDPVGELELFAPNGDRLEKDWLAEKTIGLLWVAEEGAKEQILEFAKLKREIGDAKLEFAVVYGDEFLQHPGTETDQLADGYRDMFQTSGLTLLHDRQMQASAKLKLKFIPAVVVLDENGKMQFAKAIDTENWVDQLSAAINRVAAGEQVADEMRTEYGKFLDAYQAQLLAASSNAKSPNQADLEPFHQHAELIWKIDSLQNAGNIHVAENSDQICVLDGWQSIVVMDLQGNIVNTHRLDLPTETAVNRIRSFRDAAGKLTFVVFALLGKRAFVFDDHWQMISPFPEQEKETDHGGISECQLGDFDSNGELDLWISIIDDEGLKQVELSSGREKQISSRPCKSFYRSASHLFSVHEGTLSVDDQPPAQQLSGWKFVRVTQDPFDRVRCLAIAMDQSFRWQVLSLSADGTIAWSGLIGSQFFDNEIDSVCTSLNGSLAEISIASIDKALIQFTDNGRSSRQFQLDRKITGLASLIWDGASFVVMSDENGVFLWKMRKSSITARPVSQTKSR